MVLLVDGLLRFPSATISCRVVMGCCARSVPPDIIQERAKREAGTHIGQQQGRHAAYRANRGERGALNIALTVPVLVQGEICAEAPSCRPVRLNGTVPGAGLPPLSLAPGGGKILPVHPVPAVLIACRAHPFRSHQDCPSVRAWKMRSRWRSCPSTNH